MQFIIAIFLCFITLQAGSFIHVDTYEVILPERFKDIFELPRKLTSNNAEIFPDLSTLDEQYHKEFYELQEMQMPDDKAPSGYIFLNIQLDYFLSFGGCMIPNIFVYDLPCIYDAFPDILSKTKEEQAQLTHIWYATKKPFYQQMQWAMQCISSNVRFSNDPIDQWGRLIINDVDFFSGYHANAFTYTICLPENLRELFELPGKLISNNPGEFPDPRMIQAGKYEDLYRDFQRLITSDNNFLVPDETLKDILKEKLDADGVQKNYRILFYFFRRIDKHLSKIFAETKAILTSHQAFFDWPKFDQAKTVYNWFESKKSQEDAKLIDIRFFDHFINRHLRFSNVPEDRFGRLIINGEEVYRGENQDE